MDSETAAKVIKHTIQDAKAQTETLNSLNRLLYLAVENGAEKEHIANVLGILEMQIAIVQGTIDGFKDVFPVEDDR